MSVYLSVQEAAEYLRLRPQTLYNKISRRELPHFKVGNRVLFDRAQLDAWVRGHAVAPAGGGDGRTSRES